MRTDKIKRLSHGDKREQVASTLRSKLPVTRSWVGVGDVPDTVAAFCQLPALFQQSRGVLAICWKMYCIAIYLHAFTTGSCLALGEAAC